MEFAEFSEVLIPLTQLGAEYTPLYINTFMVISVLLELAAEFLAVPIVEFSEPSHLDSVLFVELSEVAKLVFKVSTKPKKINIIIILPVFFIIITSLQINLY